ncbi:barstar family protein [Pseudomonas koreensis]|uniref:barstar family protein n=1 Tax=Pseudomonas koreensis TaxID=198620 RepID=UPI003F86E04F
METTPSYDSAEVFYVLIDPSIQATEELIRSLYYLLWLPGYFGYNWDALYDCLRDLSWVPCHKIVLVHESLPELPRDDLKIYLEILRDSVLDWIGDDGHELEVVFKEVDRAVAESLLKIRLSL